MSANDLSSESNLAQRAACGDDEALQIFFDRFADPLFAFIYHQLDASVQDAEEVWQASLLAAVNSLGNYRAGSSLFTWLCGIARHKIADHHRRANRASDVFTDLAPQRISQLMAAAPLPEEIILQRATRLAVIKALTSLADDYRRALVARYVHECPVAEVGRMLGKSYKATESLLTRARTALRQALERQEEEHEPN